MSSEIAEAVRRTLPVIGTGGGLNRTPIEWTDWSANALKLMLPDGALVNACVKISEGCRRCYAESMVRRFWRKAWRKKLGKFPGYSAALLKLGRPVLLEGVLRAVLRLDRQIAEGKADPAVNKIFWHDMTDEFLLFWPGEMLDRIWAVRALTPRLIHQVLTKRPERAAEYTNVGRRVNGEWNIGQAAFRIAQEHNIDWDVFWRKRDFGNVDEPPRWPLKNVWLGTSVEDQPAADKRIPELLRCRAAVRFLSCEPLLGPLDLSGKLLGGFSGKLTNPGETFPIYEGDMIPRIDQAILGCESVGSRAGRFADGYEAAARSLLDQCRVASVAAFHKQMPVDGKVSGDPKEWPKWARVRQYPQPAAVSA